MAYKGYTEAHKRATMKYLASNTDDIRLRMPKGTKDRWRQAAESHGISMTKFVAQSVERAIAELDGNNYTENNKAENLPPETPSNNPMQL